MLLNLYAPLSVLRVFFPFLRIQMTSLTQLVVLSDSEAITFAATSLDIVISQRNMICDSWFVVHVVQQQTVCVRIACMVPVHICPPPFDVLGGQCRNSVQSHQCKIWGNQRKVFRRWPRLFFFFFFFLWGSNLSLGCTKILRNPQNVPNTA